MNVSYDRHALHGIEDTELRMTFDSNLQSRYYDFLLELGPYGKQFIDSDLVVLEGKVNDSVRLWLTRILQEVDCKQRSASKFCTSLELLKESELPVGTTYEQVIAAGGM